MEEKVYTLTRQRSMFDSDYDGYMALIKEPTSSEFHPKKHTVMSYSKQNRIAKSKRRRNGRKK